MYLGSGKPKFGKGPEKPGRNVETVRKEYFSEREKNFGNVKWQQPNIERSLKEGVRGCSLQSLEEKLNC